MQSLRKMDRQVGRSLVTLILVLFTAIPSLLPALASAAQLQDRSITLSTSTVSATNVTYEVKFTAQADAAAYIIDFCNDSPVPGQTCTAPGGFSTASVGTSTGGATVSSFATSTVKVVQDITASEDVDLVLTGITNPNYVTDATANHGFYARIVTYDTSNHADNYTDTDSGTGAVDDGGVAMAITNEIGVTAAVRETMTFCVAGADITANCANASSHAPNLVLGESVGNAKALSPTAISTGSVYTQLTTNAASGAVVNLKSNATSCGGLLRLGAPGACDIGPATTGGFSAGEAKFGVKTSSAYATSGVTDTTGTLEPVNASGYNGTTYFMGYVAGNGSGVTSTYGDPFLDSNDAPINNQNMQLTFGASASNNTPAGTYSANLSMIATGKY